MLKAWVRSLAPQQIQKKELPQQGFFLGKTKLMPEPIVNRVGGDRGKGKTISTEGKAKPPTEQPLLAC